MLSAYSGSAIRSAEAPLLDAGQGAALMQRAAYGLYAAAAAELISRTGGCYGRTAVVLAGSGNNAGDALFAAARLAGRGVRTTAVFTSATTHPLALAAFQRAGGRVELLSEATTGRLVGSTAAADLVIDGILGIGGSGGLREPAATFVRELAAAATGVVVACDLPSGVDAHTGVVNEPVLHADLTVTFGALKTGLLAGPGAHAAGRVVVVDIGLAGSLPEPDLFRLEAADAAALYRRPRPADHKYTRGVLGIAAGSAMYPGAAVLATGAALATGLGMVRYLGPPSVADLVNRTHPEAVCSQEQVKPTHVQAWLVGPGADEDPDQRRRARDAMASGLPTVVDAGALALLPRRLAPQVILTPHAGELQAVLAKRKVKATRRDIEAAPTEYARIAAELTGATVLLKGAVTVVASPSGSLFSQADATPWLATAGSGDTLAGILGALIATLADDDGDAAIERIGVPMPDKWAAIAAAAALLHGLAGTRAAGFGPIVVSELPQHLGAVLADLLTAPPSRTQFTN
ncbi:NAD(P)H-hydrate epimerase [Arthrobacter flavus]|uniref:Bifunctional NAD(P)H-hydrate repair enzyme n=1 Tax=Arthrobacter flavus TaxID=95172 RepID=A0ABW4Q1N7_9MICC